MPGGLTFLSWPQPRLRSGEAGTRPDPLKMTDLIYSHKDEKTGTGKLRITFRMTALKMSISRSVVVVGSIQGAAFFKQNFKH